MEEVHRPRPPRRAFKTTVWGAVAVLGAALLVPIGVPLTSVFFAPEPLENCSVTERPAAPRARRSGGLYPRVYTDCGVFRVSSSSTRSGRQAPCTTDPALPTSLIAGHTYDLEVRGLHFPFAASREIVSATVSPQQQQPIKLVEPLEPNTDNAALNELIREFQDSPEHRQLKERLDQLRAETSPEVLRAFDYEQPPYSPSCDVSRLIMTSKGLQLMVPQRAAEVLTPPPGTTARDPLLPCEGFGCAPAVNQ